MSKMSKVIDGDYKGKLITLTLGDICISTSFFGILSVDANTVESYQIIDDNEHIVSLKFKTGKHSVINIDEKIFAKLLEKLHDLPQEQTQEPSVDSLPSTTQTSESDLASASESPQALDETSQSTETELQTKNSAVADATPDENDNGLNLAVSEADSLSKKICIMCGGKTGFLTRTKLADSYLCPKCLCKVSHGLVDPLSDVWRTISAAQLLEFAANLQNKRNDINEELKIFTLTKPGNKRLLIDEKHRLLKIAPECKTFTRYNNDDYDIFRFDQIAAYELVEDGSCIARGGLGRAALGALAFGGVGAVVGAATAKAKDVCNLLQIKLSIRDSMNSNYTMDFITSETKKNSIVYKTYFKEAQQCLSDLDIITATVNATTPVQPPEHNDVTEEIRKYKTLLDDNIITQAEFDAKKKQLLGL